MRFHSFFATAVTLSGTMLISTAAMAHDYRIGEIRVDHPRARATAPAQPAGAAYLTLENFGKSADKLIAVSTPIAKSAEIHTMSTQNNMMKMREVGTIELKASDKISMQPGDGYHIMLMGLKQPLKLGDKFPLTLNFEKAGKLEVSVWVEEMTIKNEPGSKEVPRQHHH